MKLKKVEPRNYWMSDMFPTNFNRLVNQFFDENVSEMSPNQAFFRPSTEIKENDDSFNLNISVPGIKKNEIKIELNNGRFANGDYFVQVKTRDRVTTKKLIVLK